MARLNVNCGTFRCARGEFHPTGEMQELGPRANPRELVTGDTMSARLFVGLSVKSKPTWTLADVVKRVSKLRNKQTGDPSSSFIAQTGVYKHHDGRRVVTEKSVQVVIINFHGGTIEDFTDQITDIGETLSKQLKQESVIVETQVNGVTKQIWTVTPEK